MGTALPAAPGGVLTVARDTSHGTSTCPSAAAAAARLQLHVKLPANPSLRNKISVSQSDVAGRRELTLQ